MIITLEVLSEVSYWYFDEFLHEQGIEPQSLRPVFYFSFVLLQSSNFLKGPWYPQPQIYTVAPYIDTGTTVLTEKSKFVA